MVGYLLFWLNKFHCLLQVRKGHSKTSQEDIVDVLDKQLLEEEQEMRRKCKSVGIGFIFYSV